MCFKTAKCKVIRLRTKTADDSLHPGSSDCERLGPDTGCGLCQYIHADRLNPIPTILKSVCVTSIYSVVLVSQTVQFSATVQTSVKVFLLGTIFPHIANSWKKAESTCFWTWNLVRSSPSEMPSHLQWISCSCGHCQLSHQLPDEGSSFRAALLIVSEETRPCGNQRVQNIAEDLLDKWWCWIGKITLCSWSS